MSWRTNKAVLALRNIGRLLRINKLVGLMMAGKQYEDRFQSALLGEIKPADVVWDVGANVGLYSAEFAERTGVSGKVVAFEPSPVNLERLRTNTANRPNVQIVPAGLGQRTEVLSFLQGEDDLGATSRIVGAGAQGNTVSVNVVRADELLARGEIPAPNVIKIDTEGYELDVLLGMGKLLSDKTLKAVCIEVHFGLLEVRGLPDAPAQIEAMLQKAGFSLRWPDASHIVASRPV